MFLPIILISIVILTACGIEQQVVKKELVPTITIPEPEGSKGFGMPQKDKDGNPIPRGPRISASVTDPREMVATNKVL